MLEKEVFERLEKLEAAVFGTAKVSLPRENNKAKKELEYDLNIRAFMKTYASKKSGPQKFVLMVAYLTKGEQNVPVALASVAKEWGNMTVILGKFNRFYSAAAKERGWVNPAGKGAYNLSNNWDVSLNG